ncbi:MAG: NAD(P)-dependent oxidoreductase, partial [Acidobacteria bacterium]
LSNADSVRRLFREVRPSVVFHLAGYVQGSRDLDQVSPALTGNLTTAVNVLTSVAETGCERLVMAGSHDEPDPGEACATAFVPPSPYAAAKFAGSAYARMFHALYGCPVTIVRVFMGYGPGQRDLKKLIPYVILSLLRGHSPRLGTGWRPLDRVYVDDIVEGILRASSSASLAGSTIPLGTGVAFTVREAVEKIAEMMQSRAALSFGEIPDRPLEKARVADVAVTRAMLGWHPRVTFDAGLRRTIAWYRAQVQSGAIQAG